MHAVPYKTAREGSSKHFYQVKSDLSDEKLHLDQLITNHFLNIPFMLFL